MNINGLNQNYIDVANANNVSSAILNALEKKSVDYSKGAIQGFNRRTLGLDLYSQKTDLNIQRQIALTNAGLMNAQINLNSISALNAMAAQASYAANAISVSEDETYSEIDKLVNSIEADTNSDKDSSNPFYFVNLPEKEVEEV